VKKARSLKPIPVITTNMELGNQGSLRRLASCKKEASLATASGKSIDTQSEG
jgi:hypothetical protein